MRHDLTDDDVRTFALAGCNAAEIAAYTGTGETVAQARLNHAIREIGSVAPKPVLHLRGRAWPDENPPPSHPRAVSPPVIP